MKKILSFCAAMLVAIAANAQTDFAAPGYSCAADAAVLTGGSSGNFFLDETADPHHIAWSDVSLSSNALATWTVTATRGCYVTVSLDLGPVIASNKHNFEVTIKDASGNVKGMLTEGGENTASDQVKTLSGTILIPAAGVYTVELYNNRDWGKGTIKNVILTYESDAPAEVIEVTSIELNKTELAVEVDEVEQLVATVLPVDAFDPSVTWESNEPTIATVKDGFISALAEGTATITAKAGEKSATCAVTVAAATIPSTDFAESYALTAKKAKLDGAIWKMYTSDTYKLYGDGDHNKNYGTAIWNINVTRPCIVSGVLNGVEGGHIFGLDLYKGEELIGSLEQPDGKTWSKGEIALDGTLTFAAAGGYTLKLRNTQEWSSGKAAGVTLTYEGAPAEPLTLYLKLSADWAGWPARYAIYTWKVGVGDLWVPMTLVENETDIYTASIPADNDKLVFVRLNGETTGYNWDEKWSQTVDLDMPAENTDLFTVTGGGTGSECTGTWSKYGEVIPEVKFKIAGSMTEWAPSIESYADTYTFENLAAGKYQMKVVDGDWLGIDAMTEVAGGLYKDQDNNICFILAEAGNVTVTYTAEAFTLAGNFVAPEVQLIGINGWDASKDAIALTPAEDKKSSSVKLNLTGEWYDFKVIRAGEWLGKENEGSDNYRIWAEHNWVDALVRDYDGLKAISLQPNGAGDYTFTYDNETGKLTVTFPGEPTAIENTNAAVKAVKRIENGQMIIIKNGVKFNAIGTVVK